MSARWRHWMTGLWDGLCEAGTRLSLQNGWLIGAPDDRSAATRTGGARRARSHVMTRG